MMMRKGSCQQTRLEPQKLHPILPLIGLGPHPVTRIHPVGSKLTFEQTLDLLKLLIITQGIVVLQKTNNN